MTWQLKRLKSMKLPIAKLSSVKLQSLKPLKELAKKLSSLEKARFARTQKFTRVQKGKSAPRIAMTLLLVRPWVLVLGFWIFSMGIGTLALGGMLSPRKLTTALPEPTVDVPVANASQLAETPAAIDTNESGESTAVENADAASTTATTTGATNNSGLTLALPMFLLVSACAVGCFIISRRRAMKMIAARARVRKARGGLTINTTARPKAVASKASSSKANGRKVVSARETVSTADSVRPVRKALVHKLTLEPRHSPSELRAKKRRRHSKIAPPVRTAANGRKLLASRATALRSGVPSGQAQTRFRKGAIRAASRRRHPMRSPSDLPVVSVVPANESHALDWHEESLAHQMDVRPHRSAM